VVIEKLLNVFWGVVKIGLLAMKQPKNLNVYALIDEAISDLLALELEGVECVKVKDILQFVIEIDSLIPEIIIDGDEFVKHFRKKTLWQRFLLKLK